MIEYAHLLRMRLSLILSFIFVIPTLQDVSPVQTNVGSDANFSFMLTEDPNTAFVYIQNKSGGFVLTASGNMSASNDPFYKDRVHFTGNSNQKLSFILRNVTLHDSGIYIAILVFSNRTRTIGSQMLIVKAAPTKPQIVEFKGHAVNGTNYHLNCSAQSNSHPPNHNLSMFSEWRKDDKLINSSGRYIVNGTELTITGVSYKQDNGSTLSCVAFEDQLSKSVNSDKFIMDVKCHPRTDSRFSHETKIYKRRYEAAVLRYTVISYPLPTFNWTFLGNGSESRYLNFSHNNGLQSELWFSSLGIDDFGNYSVIADNSLPPSAREVFEIIPADVPEVPSNVTIVEITQTSMKVQWTAGNNGGLKQIFHVVVTAGSQVCNVTADDPGYRENGTFVLDGLLPKTKYSIYMIASNLYGSSNMTEAINITTLEAITPDSSSRTFPLPAVAGGLGAGVVVILLAALFLWRRYHHRSQHADGIKQDDKERSRPVIGTQRNQINANSVRHDAADRQDYEGLHINNTEASEYLQLNDITLEENIYANARPPENDSYETLHPNANTDIQMYSSLKIPKISKDSEKVYENTQIKKTDFNC